ncbi:20068_t:CDS:2 [Gigaspora rosea]|nr:20068_t:CDS:2 [Gigaspora rosea]
MDGDWDLFIMVLDIFNDINLLSLSDNEDSDIIINKNLYPSLSNYDDSVIFNTNLLPLAENSNNHPSFSICGDNFLSLYEYVDNVDTKISLFFENSNNSGNINASNYQYNLRRSTFHNDKNLNDPSIIRRKSFHCSSSGIYISRKIIDQNSHRVRGTIKTNCEWHCNFTLPKTTHQIRCTTLKDTHNHKINPAQISDVIARYRPGSGYHCTSMFYALNLDVYVIN